MIDQAYRAGATAALLRFKLSNAANPSMAPGSLGSGQSAATSMAMAIPKPAVQPNAPIAAQAHKANVLG